MEHEQISLGATFTPQEDIYVQSPKENNYVSTNRQEESSSTTSSR